MNRRTRLDAVVAGGGVVGSACALALAAQGLDVALVEAAEPARWSPAVRDLRVYAFAPDNAALLAELGAWDAVRGARAQPYRHMRVWDAAGGGDLRFDADAFARPELGWIVEHGLLADRLWQALARSSVRVLCPARVEGLDMHDNGMHDNGMPRNGMHDDRMHDSRIREDGVRLRLDDGTTLEARIAVAADGADSTLRALAGIEVDTRDYAQRGVVGFVSSARPHADTAWQRFQPGGPLALLPFADGDCSIVWSLPQDEAARVLALDDGAFADAVTRASDGCLGALRPSSPRVAFPLRRQLARETVRGRVLLVGDAAHVVHPLAGQGVNLGLRDVAALAASVAAARAKGGDYAAPQRLARWARARRSENALAAHAFDGLHRLFSTDAPLPLLLRGPLLGAAGAVPPLAHRLWMRASGLG